MNTKKFIAVMLVVCIMIVLNVKPYTKTLPREQSQEVALTRDTKEIITLDDRGKKDIGYVLEFHAEKGMLSRDGSKSIEVASGVVLNQEGMYYLTAQGEVGEVIIIRVEIVGEIWQGHYQIDNVNELEEMLKKALEEFVTTFSFQLVYGELTLEQVNQHVFGAIERVMKQYPQLIFESYTIVGRTDINPTVEIEITYPIKDIEKLKRYQQIIEDQTPELLAGFIGGKQQDYEREWEIYQYIIENVSYGLKDNNAEEPLPMMHTLYGALIEGIAVCDGYAKAIMYLFNNAGIPTELIVGDADGVLHAWNKVKIQEEYYYVDATWGDLEKQQIGDFYNYFNETQAYMEETHSWEEESEEQAAQTNYTFINLPFKKEGLNKVSNKDEWESTLKKLKKYNIKESSIIFFNLESNKWDNKEIIAELCNQMQSSLEYHIIQKYDALIINYRLYNEMDRVRK